ncbi:MAG: hypothetical protein NTW28_23820 [Candidatus Solibacter sp.]|nr:hypothetical protein [Candidatus Solibacter sp.]
MRNALAYSLLFTMIALTSIVAQDKKAPTTLVLAAKNGNVTYDHTAHAKREKNECKTCHPAQWPQDAKAPLNWKAAMHKAAETAKTSCGSCHQSFRDQGQLHLQVSHQGGRGKGLTCARLERCASSLILQSENARERLRPGRDDCEGVEDI